MVEGGRVVTVLLRGGTVVTASDTYRADVLVGGEKIREIGEHLDVAADTVIDAGGKYVIPGGVDVHTHMGTAIGDMIVSDKFATGTRAGAMGGTTTVIDFAVQEPGQSLMEACDSWRRKADGEVFVDYGLHVIVRDLPDKALPDLDILVREGITTFKFFMAYSVYSVGDSEIFKALLRTTENGGLVLAHAENGSVIETLRERAVAARHSEPKWHALTRPPEAEAEATNRVLRLAEIAGAPVYIVHLSAAEALAEVREFRGRGLPAYAETCPQYLYLSYDNYEEPGFNGAKYVVCPPLRPKWHQDRLWNGLASNDLQVVSTDHCTWSMSGQKDRGKDDFAQIPPGAPGIETRMALMYNGVRSRRISLNRWVELTSTAPAKIFGLYPRKGAVAVGGDADLVVWDPNADMDLSVKNLHMQIDYSPYEGLIVKGKPTAVLSRGEILVRDGQFSGSKGRGRFLKRAAFSDAWGAKAASLEASLSTAGTS